MPARIHTIRQEMSDLKSEATALLDLAAAEGNRSLTPAEAKKCDAITARLDALKPELEREVRFQDACRDGTVGETWPVGASGAARPAAGPARGKTFADLFGSGAIDSGGFKDMNEFVAALHEGRADPRLAFNATRLQATGMGSIPSDGGFAVPSQLTSLWMDASLEDEVVRPRATVYAMSGGELKIPGFDANSHASTLFGGFAGGWVAEAQEITPESPKLRLVSLVARKLGVLAEVSNELLSDSISYSSQLGSAIVKAIGWYLDYGFLFGTGTSQPLGVLNSPCLVTVAKETQQSSATILYHNLTKMFARLPAQCVRKSVWIASPTTIPYLTCLTIDAGTSGHFVPAMSETDGTFKLLTRPVVFSEKLPPLGNLGDIMLCDFTQYGIGLRQDMVLDKSMHPGFTRDTSHYRGILRGDGCALWNAPLTLKNGTTVSPFVALAERS